MSDSIKNDDKKFNDLITKQNSTYDSFIESNKELTDIEKDDEKLDRLFEIQTEEVTEHDSLEEKYETEILIQEITKLLGGVSKNRLEEGEDLFSQFFIDEDEA